MLLVVEDKSRLWLQSFIWMCISIGLISYSAAYSHGGSLAACSDMRPKHIRAQPQNPRKNYITIHTNHTFYLPGDKVPVTIRSTRDFMGFFLQARRVLNDQVAGSFVFIPPGSKLLRCFEDGDTVTHSDKSLKRNLSFVWKSPDQPVGDIKFFVSVVQSYFVYWARIESAIVSGHMLKRTSETQRSEVSDMEPAAVLESKRTSPLPYTELPFFNSPAKTKPPETLLYTISGKGKYTLSDVLFISNSSTTMVTSTSKVTASTMDSSLQFSVSSASQTLSPQNRTLNHSTDSRNQYGLQSPSPTVCSSCKDKSEMVSSNIRFDSPTPSLPPDSLGRSLTSTSPTQEIQADTTLQESHSHFLLPSISGEQRYKPINKVAANYLQQPESASSDNNIKVEESTFPQVTKTVQETGIHSKEGEKGRGMHLAMTQLGILLGCSVVLGMSLAAGLRCIHAQYCHKRTEVSFSEPDDNVITLRENGEMMHFKKIRENSFVLVQAEYNWITPALSAKTQ